jgi:TFIIF-interacting CTD phosphatase-like protein
MSKKLNVVLDLDQTLICAEELKNFDVKKHKQKMRQYRYEIFENLYVIFERPGLQNFLDYLFSKYNVAVWTAASKDYALFVINNFILNKEGRKLDFIFYSHHCELSTKIKKGLKSLEMLWDVFKLKRYKSSNTVIIDDNPAVRKKQECNVIAVKQFYFENRASYRDSEFDKVKETLEKLDKNLKTLGTIKCTV